MKYIPIKEEDSNLQKYYTPKIGFNGDKMLQIKLNGINGAGKYALVSPEDYPRLARFSWYYREGYALAKIDGHEIRMHRYIMDVHDPDMIVDHKDRNRLNNTRGNLRIINYLENANNRTDNVFIDCFGEKKTIAEWSRDARCVVSYDALRARIRKGIEPWAAILAPGGEHPAEAGRNDIVA